MEKKKNILVVNDDGIQAEGIHKLAEALSKVGEVYVCSPHVQQSASGHGITIGRFAVAEEEDFPEATAAFSLEGTPADCVKIGLLIFGERGVEMDMVFSGFNHGSNLGSDILYSGTASAAVEGAFCGLPSAAMSICSKAASNGIPENYEAGMDIAQKIACSEPFQEKDDGQKTLEVTYIRKPYALLNVNIPDLPPEKIKGIKVCPLSYHAYDKKYEKRLDEDGRTGYRFSSRPTVVGEVEIGDSDVIASKLEYTTITPLHFDLTDYRIIEKLREEWNE